MITDISHTQEIYTVTRLNREVRLILEGSFPIFWLEGEISNFVAPHSGHWYFSLKDTNAQVRCCMFKPQNRHTLLTPKDGMHVIVKARVGLYEGRGEFQLLVETMEEAGLGKLQQAFEELKKRLAAEGLFAIERKKKIPTMPKCIGVVTSSSGAAIRDILHVLKRRYAAVPVIIYHTLVQGELAAGNIVSAIQTANQRKECDVLIIARGGGSLEDLWPFNEEIVARAIYHSEIPTISGVGHEVDFTIADFVADVRAPTPSAAAELATPDQAELLNTLAKMQAHLTRCMKYKLEKIQQHLGWLDRHLQQQHPKKRLREKIQFLDQSEMTLKRLQMKLLQHVKHELRTYQAKIMGLTPSHRIHVNQQKLSWQLQHIQKAMLASLSTRQQQLASAAAKLDALSPLATLKRGFAIATLTKDSSILRSANEVQAGDKINVKLMNGILDCTVDKSR